MSLPRIAVDAMGGDEGVRVWFPGAALARRRHDQFNFLLVGDEARIKRALEDHPNMRGASRNPPLRRCGGGRRKAHPGAAPRQDHQHGPCRSRR